jgi:hypothetical protein
MKILYVVGIRERPALADRLSRASSRMPRLSRAKNYKKKLMAQIGL